jgi:chemotaxis protein CheD
MFEIDEELRAVYLQPGELFVSQEKTVISTVLGSCVGATFWSERLRVGGMSHSQLPKCPITDDVVSLAEGRRYVDFAIRDLARQFDELGLDRSSIQVKLFGGADVLPVKSGMSSWTTIGSQNCEEALTVLEQEGFHAIASSLRGSVGRKIQFYSETGDVLVRCLS